MFPLHSFKYVAALQEAQGGEGKVLLRLEECGGHGIKKMNASKTVEEYTDILYFLTKELVTP